MLNMAAQVKKVPPSSKTSQSLIGKDRRLSGAGLHTGASEVAETKLKKMIFNEF